MAVVGEKHACLASLRVQPICLEKQLYQLRWCCRWKDDLQCVFFLNQPPRERYPPDVSPSSAYLEDSARCQMTEVAVDQRGAVGAGNERPNTFPEKADQIRIRQPPRTMHPDVCARELVERFKAADVGSGIHWLGGRGERPVSSSEKSPRCKEVASAAPLAPSRMLARRIICGHCRAVARHAQFVNA